MIPFSKFWWGKNLVREGTRFEIFGKSGEGDRGIFFINPRANFGRPPVWVDEVT